VRKYITRYKNVGNFQNFSKLHRRRQMLQKYARAPSTQKKNALII
jgi:hypothetical protein